MANHKKTSHHRIASRRLPAAQGGGWEFFCPHCNFRAHYVIEPRSGRQKLTVLESGNPRASHSSGKNGKSIFDWPVRVINDESTPCYQAERLPVNLEAQLEQILSRLHW